MNQIYRIRNLINDKCYVGITTTSVAQRWIEHISRHRCGKRDHKLYRAFRKYGIENFICEELMTLPEEYPLGELEKCLITQFDSFQNGYNMTDGGDIVSDETKEKIRQKMIGREITWAHKIVATRRAQGVWPHGEVSGADHVKAKSYRIQHPDGKEEIIKGLRQFCKKYSLNHGCMSYTLSGKQNYHKGFRILEEFIDHPEGEYSQVAGNDTHPIQNDLPEVDLADFV